MEFQLPSFTSLLLTFVLIFMAIKIIQQKSKPQNPKPRLPPGPTKLPLIGNMHHLISRLPHHTLAKMAMKYGPLMHLQLGEVPTIVISSTEIAKEVLKDHDINFSQRPPLLAAKIMSYNSSSTVFSPYGNYWRQLRKIFVTELLSTNHVLSMRSIREEEVFALIQDISSNKGSQINLSEKVFSLTYGIMSRATFGNKNKGVEELIRVIEEVIKLLSGFCLADMYPSNDLVKLISGMRIKLEKLHQITDGILENILKEHKERTDNLPAETNLLGVLLKLQEKSDLEVPLTNNHIKAVILEILGAGADTSSTTVEWAMSELLRNPRLMKQAQDEVRQVIGTKGKVDEAAGIHELKLLRAIVKETLRLHPPGPLLPRECRQSCVIGGYDVPVKTRVLVNIWAIGRDSKYWKDALNFNPERWLENPIDFMDTNVGYIPFGIGRRMCPGMPFALSNIELALANLLYHFDWKLPNGTMCEELDMTESFGINVRIKNNLVVIPTSHHA